MIEIIDRDIDEDNDNDARVAIEVENNLANRVGEGANIFEPKQRHHSVQQGDIILQPLINQ